MSITTVKIQEKLTKLNGGCKHIDRYILISCKKTKIDHVNGASCLNMKTQKMKTGVYISRIIRNQGIFRKEDNVTLGIKIILKNSYKKKESGNAPAVRLKGFKVESAS